MRQPLISIVLPVFNGGHYLTQAIEGCLGQTYDKLELIIVDDCSTDNSLAVAGSYCRTDTRVKVLRHSQNKKLPAALNSGFAMASGEFLTWTSHDNIYAKNALETLSAYLAEHPEVGLVYSDFCFIDQEGVVTEDVNLLSPDHLIFSNVVGASFLYRRAVQERIGKYDENLFLAEDYDYWLRASRHFRLTHISDKLYYYRKHEATLTAQQFERVFLSAEKALTKFIRENKSLERETVVKIGYNLMRLAYAYRMYDKTVDYFRRNFTSAPLHTLTRLLANPEDMKLLINAYQKSMRMHKI